MRLHLCVHTCLFCANMCETDREKMRPAAGWCKTVVSTPSSCLANLPWVSWTHSISQHHTHSCTHTQTRLHSLDSSLSWFVHYVPACMSVYLCVFDKLLHRLLSFQPCCVVSASLVYISVKFMAVNSLQIKCPSDRQHSTLHQHHLGNKASDPSI